MIELSVSTPARETLVDITERVRELETLGVEFTRTTRGLALGREGDGLLRGEVAHVDRFGNLITSLRRAAAAPTSARTRSPSCCGT